MLVLQGGMLLIVRSEDRKAKLGFTALQEKARLKKEKEEVDAKYKHALVDGRKEEVMTLSKFSAKVCSEAHCRFLL